MNNAGVGGKTGSWTELDNWGKIINTNLWGIVNVQHTFVPYMIGQENQSLIINTGSKQGITNPPGNPAYNASKAAVKSLTEGLSYELRQQPTKLTAHLFVYALHSPHSASTLLMIRIQSWVDFHRSLRRKWRHQTGRSLDCSSNSSVYA